MKGVQEGTDAYFYTRDHLGSLVNLTDASLTLRARYAYDPYGRGTRTTGTRDADFGFTGHMIDRDAGLTLAYFRGYDPSLGRWLSPDPSGYTDGPNLYAYVHGNPIMFYDPLGLWTWTDLVPEIPQGVADFSAGFGDTLSFGATNKLRDWWDLNKFVDRCSNSFSAGEVAGIAYGLAAGGAAGWRSAGKKAGTEFSHWIPDRMRGPRSLWNGNYVTPARHYKHDPHRWPPGWFNEGSKYPGWQQQWERIPKVYKGAAYGAVGAKAGAAMNEWIGCGC